MVRYIDDQGGPCLDCGADIDMARSMQRSLVDEAHEVPSPSAPRMRLVPPSPLAMQASVTCIRPPRKALMARRNRKFDLLVHRGKCRRRSGCHTTARSYYTHRHIFGSDIFGGRRAHYSRKGVRGASLCCIDSYIEHGKTDINSTGQKEKRTHGDALNMSISRAEFDEACGVFVRKGIGRGGISGNEEGEKVRVQQGRHDETILRITKELAPSMTTAIVGEEVEGAKEDLGRDEVEDERDEGELLRARSAMTVPRVVYEVVYSASYQVPVLYVTFQHLPEPGLPSLERVYELLVPPELAPQLQAVGVMGSLSFSEHPVTGFPAYFVHPCRTAEVMGSVVGDGKVGPEEYLLAWLGMMGTSVGLSVSADFAMRISASQSRP
nr:ubiquitin-like-conjugating enzyme atg10 [Quercus suber]